MENDTVVTHFITNSQKLPGIQNSLKQYAKNLNWPYHKPFEDQFSLQGIEEDFSTIGSRIYSHFMQMIPSSNPNSTLPPI